MSCQSLPGIREIRMIKCADLPRHLMLRSLSGDVAVINCEGLSVNFTGEPTLTWETELLNGTLYEKSTLTFTTTHELPLSGRVAFAVTTPGREHFLMGAYEPRYPIIKYSQTTGETGRTSAVRTYTVTHVARKSILKCVL